MWKKFQPHRSDRRGQRGPPTTPDAGLRVAAQVKDIRKARHLSQRQLAGRMQVPRTYISKIENGKAIPTLGSLERLASALEVDICQLVRDGRSRATKKWPRFSPIPSWRSWRSTFPSWRLCSVLCSESGA
jgi:ribosome-binding protein aMBF1 (putative translation factor)